MSDLNESPRDRGEAGLFVNDSRPSENANTVSNVVKTIIGELVLPERDNHRRVHLVISTKRRSDSVQRPDPAFAGGSLFCLSWTR